MDELARLYNDWYYARGWPKEGCEDCATVAYSVCVARPPGFQHHPNKAAYVHLCRDCRHAYTNKAMWPIPFAKFVEFARQQTGAYSVDQLIAWYSAQAK